MAPYNYTADINWSFALGLMANVWSWQWAHRNAAPSPRVHTSHPQRKQMITVTRKLCSTHSNSLSAFSIKVIFVSYVQWSYLDYLFLQCRLEPGCVSHLPFSPVPQCWDSKSDIGIHAFFQQQKLGIFFLFSCRKLICGPHFLVLLIQSLVDLLI